MVWFGTRRENPLRSKGLSERAVSTPLLLVMSKDWAFVNKILILYDKCTISLLISK